MGSMQCNVEFGYQLCICSATKENHGKPWSNGPVSGPSGCKLTSSQQSGFKSEVEVEVNLRPTVSRPVCPGVRRPCGTCDQFFFRHVISCRQLRLCYFVAPSLTRGRVCNLLLNLFWALPEQSLLGRSPAELTALFYGLIWDSVQFLLGLARAVTPELEFFLRPTVSRPVSLDIGPPFGTLDHILSCFFFRLTITLFCFQRVLSDEKTGL
jgi:hypothetical protein